MLNGNSQVLLERLLLIQQPEVKVSQCQIPKGVVQPRTFNARNDREINILIPVEHRLLETNRAAILDAHVVLVNNNVLLEQRIVFNQVQAEIISRKDPVNLSILKEVDVSSF